MEKVLVGTPTNSVKEYVREQYISNVKSLTYPNYDIFCSDNSSDNTYHAKKFIMRGIDCGWVNPKGKRNCVYVTESQNQIKDKALKGNYDYLMMIEQDITPPNDIIEQLISYKLPIATAQYFIGSGNNTQLISFGLESESPFFGTYTNRRIEETESYIYYGTKKTRSKMFGLGCILIHRSILKKNPFIVDENEVHHSDMHLWFNIQENKIPYAVHPIICDHNNSSWQKITDR